MVRLSARGRAMAGEPWISYLYNVSCSLLAFSFWFFCRFTEGLCQPGVCPLYGDQFFGGVQVPLAHSLVLCGDLF